MNVLVFAPHPDDEILGCGGTIAKYVANSHDVYVCIATSPLSPIFDDTLMHLNNWPHNIYPKIKEAHRLLGIKETFYLGFPAADLESAKRFELNGKIIDLIQKIKPNVVFMPHFGDMQRDHTLLSEAIMVAVRPKYIHKVQSVYAYETLSETEWNIPHVKNIFIPNIFVDIDRYLAIKLNAMKCFASEIGHFPAPRSLEAIISLAKLRGSTSMVKSAEAFMLVRTYFQEEKLPV